MKYALVSLLLFCCCAFSQENGRGLKVIARDKTGEELLQYRKSYALVIGASQYTNGWPKLPGVLNDIKLVENVLKNNGFEVFVVKDPTSKKLREEFDKFIRNFGRDYHNRLLFYFAGHGYTARKKWGGEMGYIVPIDASNPEQSMDGFLDKALDMQQLEVYAKRIDAKHALFLFDSCFSGSIFALTRAIPKNISYKTAKPVRQFITSGSADEEVPDKSVFCQQFVAALGGEGDRNGDGYVTGSELGEFLQEKVINYSRESQHPQYGKIRNPRLDKGDFVFALAKRKEVVEPLPSDDFSLEDLEKEAVYIEKWKKKQVRMTNAYKKTKKYDSRNIPLKYKIKAWDRFLKSFSVNNPYSKADDHMIHEARQRVTELKKDQQRLTSVKAEISLSAPQKIFVESIGLYAVKVANKSNVTIHNATIMIDIPSGLDYKGKSSGILLRWKITSLPSWQSKTIQFTLRGKKQGDFTISARLISKENGRKLSSTQLTIKVEKKKLEAQYYLRIISLNDHEYYAAMIRKMAEQLKQKGIYNSFVRKSGNYWVLDIGPYVSIRSEEAIKMKEIIINTPFQGVYQYKNVYWYAGKEQN